MVRLGPLLLVVLAGATIAACSLAISVDGLAGPELVQDDGASPPVDAAGRDVREADAQPDAATAAYRATVLADAPLAYYRLDLSAGDLVKDELGAHDGHVKGALTRVDGAIAGDPSHAALFDGASYVLIGDVLPFDGTASFTLEVWAQPFVANSSPMCMVSKNIPGDGGALRDGYSFFLDNDTGRVTQNRYRDGVEENAVGPAIAPGAFRHLVATFDGAAIRIYVDGEKVAERASSAALPIVANPLTLGASRGGTYCFFRGALDEIAIYGKALAPERIRAHHTVGVGQ